MTAKLGLCEKVNTDMIADENLKIIFSSLDDIETFISDTYNWADSQWTIDRVNKLVINIQDTLNLIKCAVK